MTVAERRDHGRVGRLSSGARAFTQHCVLPAVVTLQCLGFKWELHLPQLFQSETLTKLYVTALGGHTAGPGKELGRLLPGTFSPGREPRATCSEGPARRWGSALGPWSLWQ